jgi:hypothetical protein
MTINQIKKINNVKIHNYSDTHKFKVNLIQTKPSRKINMNKICKNVRFGSAQIFVHYIQK